MSDVNPLLETWNTKFKLPPFDRIKPAHFMPAFKEAMRRHRADVDAVIADPSPPDFANTIEALERCGRDLGRVSGVFYNLVSSLGGAALEEIDRELSPLMAKHHGQIALDQDLFKRVEAVVALGGKVALDEDQRRLLERTHLGFVRSGAALDAVARGRMQEISERLAVLHTAFGQNVLADEKSWSLALADDALDGLPDFLIESARRAAQERGVAGQVMTLSRSLVEPFLMFSARRDLRRVAYEAWIARGMHDGAHDNRVLIPEILALRRERAQLLGYADFVEYKLADSMAGDIDAVRQLFASVWEPAKQKAGVEAARLLEAARADGVNDDLQAWDWRYYAEKVRLAEYALDETEIKPYFVLENIQQAAFDTANKLFGLTFSRIDVPLYHPDVRAYEVRDAQGHVGVFLADHLARGDKRSGAWMSSFRDQETLDGVVSPIIVNNNNFAQGAPTLLSFDDARTLFHEFGHGLHGLLSRVRYPSQSGTSVRRDFVELPSQIYEHWIELPETLAQYARHHETGQPISQDLIDRLMAARTFNQGFATVEYMGSALIDMALHAHDAPDGIDVAVFEAAFLHEIGMPAAIGLRHRSAHFSHLFSGGGYAAGYYSYLWAEVLDADGFEAFEEAKDHFEPGIAARLRALLQSGDTRDPMALYLEFRGRAPDSAALLRGRGLALN